METMSSTFRLSKKLVNCLVSPCQYDYASMYYNYILRCQNNEIMLNIIRINSAISRKGVILWGMKWLIYWLLSLESGRRLPSTRPDRPIWWRNLSICQQWGCPRGPGLPGQPSPACGLWGSQGPLIQRGLHVHGQEDCTVHWQPHMG